MSGSVGLCVSTLTEGCRVREREGGKEGVKERKREDRKVGSSSRTGSDHFIQHLCGCLWNLRKRHVLSER